MTETTTTPPVEEDFEFSYGAEGAEGEAKAIPRRASSNLQYWSLGEDEECLVRFINDAFSDPDRPDLVPYITIMQHAMVPTRPGPKDAKNWPAKMSSVCRHAKAFRGKYVDCFICDFMTGNSESKSGKYEPSPRTFCLVAMREEVIGDGTDELGGAAMKGKVVGIRDKVREIPKIVDGKAVEGETITVKDVQLMNQGRKNFFAIMEGFAGKYNTLLDRDYYIKRKGKGNDTVYQIAPADKIEMEGGKFYDLRVPEIMARYGEVPDLRKIVAEKASDEFYARFWDTRVEFPESATTTTEGGAASTPTPQADVEDEAKMAELRSRIKGGGESPAPAAEAPAAEAPAAEPAAAGGGMRAL